MPDSDFEWLSVNECRNMGQLLNYADGRIAIFDTGLFNYRENEENEKSFIFYVDSEYPPELHERDDDYPVDPEVTIIERKITGEKQHNLRAQYFGAVYPYSLKLICLFLQKKHYVVLGQLLRFYFDRGMRLVKVHRAIRFKSSQYVASYIAHNTAKRQHFKHDNFKKAFYKLMKNAPYGKNIENVARHTDIRLLNNLEITRKLAE